VTYVRQPHAHKSRGNRSAFDALHGKARHEVARRADHRCGTTTQMLYGRRERVRGGSGPPDGDKLPAVTALNSFGYGGFLARRSGQRRELYRHPVAGAVAAVPGPPLATRRKKPLGCHPRSSPVPFRGRDQLGSRPASAARGPRVEPRGKARPARSDTTPERAVAALARPPAGFAPHFGQATRGLERGCFPPVAGTSGPSAWRAQVAPHCTAASRQRARRRSQLP